MNILAALFNVFSFSIILPILQILFKINNQHYELIPWDTVNWSNLIDVAKNNGYYYSQQLIDIYGPATTLLLLGLILSFLTLLKTLSYFGGSAMLAPLRTGIVRDIRNSIYQKIVQLPLSFFSEERKGDIMTRITADVNEVDNSITSSLDMVIKNPIFILVYVDRDVHAAGQGRDPQSHGDEVEKDCQGDENDDNDDRNQNSRRHITFLLL